jgi:hypothetical protein
MPKSRAMSRARFLSPFPRSQRAFNLIARPLSRMRSHHCLKRERLTNSASIAVWIFVVRKESVT